MNKIYKDLLSLNNENESYLTNFLDEAEQSDLEQLIGKVKKINFFGGFLDAERRRAQIGDKIIEPDFEIVIFEITYNKKFLSLSHRHVLGTIMSLGINRDVIGDIIIVNNDMNKTSEGLAYFFSTKEMVSYLQNNFTAINNIPINLRLVSYEDVKNYTIKQGIDKKIIVASFRLDSIIASSYNLSRNEAQELINKKLVFINHRNIINNHHIVNIGDIISIRKYGRLEIVTEISKTKKENIIILIRMYR